MEIRKYNESDVPAMVCIWNEVVEEGVAFPQEEFLDEESGRAFFAAQSCCGVAVADGRVVGLYILHPNNIGRCGHIANASYAVDSVCRGEHVGEKLVSDCLVQAAKLHFRLLQFNAVVENNIHARHLYERLGFTQVGIIPGGFRIISEYLSLLSRAITRNRRGQKAAPIQLSVFFRHLLAQKSTNLLNQVDGSVSPP